MLHKLDDPYMDNDYDFNTVHSLLNNLYHYLSVNPRPLPEHAGQDVAKAGQGYTALFYLTSSSQRVCRYLLIRAELLYIYIYTHTHQSLLDLGLNAEIISFNVSYLRITTAGMNK